MADDEDDDINEEEFPEDDEPTEGDYITTDHRTFYQDGKKVVEVSDAEYDADPEAGMRAVVVHMEKEQFWPSVWFQSDHGNNHRIDMTEYYNK